MMSTLERSAPVSTINWRGHEWRHIELQVIRRLAEQAGRYAYQGAGWKPSAVRAQARSFIVQSSLLSPYRDDPGINGLVISHFLRGWYAQEIKETSSWPMKARCTCSAVW